MVSIWDHSGSESYDSSSTVESESLDPTSTFNCVDVDVDVDVENDSRDPSQPR